MKGKCIYNTDTRLAHSSFPTPPSHFFKKMLSCWDALCSSQTSPSTRKFWPVSAGTQHQCCVSAKPGPVLLLSAKTNSTQLECPDLTCFVNLGGILILIFGHTCWLYCLTLAVSEIMIIVRYHFEIKVCLFAWKLFGKLKIWKKKRSFLSILIVVKL